MLLVSEMSSLTPGTWFLLAPSGGSDGKESACNAGDLGSIPGLERSPGEGKGKPLQYACLENPIDGGAWQATVHGVVNSQTDRVTLKEISHPVCGPESRLWSPAGQVKEILGALGTKKHAKG